MSRSSGNPAKPLIFEMITVAFLPLPSWQPVRYWRASWFP